MKEVAYCLTADDLVAGLSHFRTNRKPFYKRPIILFGILLFICALLGVLQSGAAPQLDASGIYGLICVAIAFISLFLPSQTKWGLRRAAKRSLRNPRDAEKILGETVLRIDSKGVSFTSDWGSTFTLWEGVERIEMTSDHLFFYVNTQTAFIVPKRAFEDQRAFQSFAITAQAFKRGENSSSEHIKPADD